MAKTLKSIDELMQELHEGKIQITVVRKEIQPVHFQQLVLIATAMGANPEPQHAGQFWMMVERYGLSLEQGMEILRIVNNRRETNGREK